MQWGNFFLLGGGNLTRSDFEHSENSCLVGGDESLIGGGTTILLVWGFFLVGGR